MNTNIREYGDKLPVDIVEDDGRLLILAENEGGYNHTYVDLVDVIEWVKANKPELLKKSAQ